ncbi:MAG: hypothetical protein JO186_02325 [Actinobacteria bacterium]|nr:hypothetical protein [Actinomycetota bacterium]
MKRLLLVPFAVLALAGAAHADITVGVNDDAGEIGAFSSWFYGTMYNYGLKVDTLTLQWDEGSPTTIANQAAITAAIQAAASEKVSIELDLYPLHSQGLTDGKSCAPSTDPEACGDTARIQQFASWAGRVASAFPGVQQFVIMNECNQPLFLNPQWDTSGHNQSAEVCGRALAAAYTAIKSTNPSDFVWGVGLSPRGNDNPRAASDSSTSPVRFLQDIGAWFRAFAQKTHRTTGIMDGLDFHPYPIPQSLSFDNGYSDPNDATVSNLPRIYQAFYDGFHGTRQKTIGQQAGGGLPVSLNEVGIQTGYPVTKAQAYSGQELSAGAAGGVYGKYATEDYQESWYYAMLSTVACDANVRLVNIFHLIDEVPLSGWQSGLFYADRTPKQSAQMVHDWLNGTGGTCGGPLTKWFAKPAKN